MRCLLLIVVFLALAPVLIPLFAAVATGSAFIAEATDEYAN